MAITAVVLSALALLVALGSAAWVLLTSSGGMYVDLVGEVDAVPGTEMSGDDLERAVAEVLEGDGWFVDRVDCPDAVVVAPDQVVTCRSLADGYDWVEHVLFHDDGTFTLLRL